MGKLLPQGLTRSTRTKGRWYHCERDEVVAGGYCYCVETETELFLLVMNCSWRMSDDSFRSSHFLWRSSPMPLSTYNISYYRTGSQCVFVVA